MEGVGLKPASGGEFELGAELKARLGHAAHQHICVSAAIAAGQADQQECIGRDKSISLLALGHFRQVFEYFKLFP